MFDLIIRNGQIVDGSGEPSFIGDVAITDGQIVEIVATIGAYLQVSKFGDALGVELEPVWYGHQPVLFAAEPPSSPAARRHLEHFMSH